MAALDGVKAICLGQFYFAPYCSMLMARLGADVIKVESPQGDHYRRSPAVDGNGDSIQMQFVNSGKRAVRLDLKQPAGQDVLKRLATNADVLVQNLSPGALDRLGLGYAQLSALNRRLIMASGTGFGSFGPYAGEPAMDLTIQASTAVMSTTGFDDGPPVRTGPSVVDFMAGAHLAAGVLAALYQRSQTGRGQHVEVALQDAIIPALTSNLAALLSAGSDAFPERTGNRHGGLAASPYNAYEASDGWITLLCPTDGHWNRLRELMQDPAADDPRFSTTVGRCLRMDDVDNIVGRWTERYPKEELVGLLKGANIPGAPVVTLPELVDDPHIRARGIVRTVNDEKGSFHALGSPLFLSDSAMVEPTRPGSLGEHTELVLRDELGMSDEEIVQLRDTGVI